MLHAYVDESYTIDWFFMAAAIAEGPRQVSALEDAFGSIIRDGCARLAIPTPDEVHGYELFQGAGAWGETRLHERLSIAGQVLEAVRDCDVHFIIRGIDRAAQRRRYPEAYEPYEMVLTHIMRQVNDYAAERSTSARIICDEIHQHDRHRAMLERHRVQGTPGYRKTTLGSVVGALEFISSTESAMIQAADIVAYLRHRMASQPDPSRAERRSRTALWRIVEDRVVHEFVWVP